MKFVYQVRTKSGQVQSGEVDAISRESAFQLLKSYGFYVTYLEEKKEPFYARRIKFFDRIPKREVVILSRQLAIMFKAEIPPLEALETIAKQTKNSLLKEKIYAMIEKIEGGASISKTFSDFPEIFSNFYLSMVKSGESIGKISDIFDYLADYLEKNYEFDRKVKGMLIYPVFLSIVFIGVVAIMVFFVLPNIMQFLQESGAEMPFLTKVLLNSVNFLKDKGWIILILILGLLVGFYYYIKTKEGKNFFDKNILNFPLLGNFFKNIYISRTALNLSALISGGIPIVRSLEITGDIVGNEIYKKIILETAERVKKGERISVSFSEHPDYFPPLFIQMLVVGEKTGRLESSLKNAITFYEGEVQRRIDNLMQLLEPVLITIFAVLIGGLMASIIMPIYQIMSSM